MQSAERRLPAGSTPAESEPVRWTARPLHYPVTRQRGWQTAPCRLADASSRLEAGAPTASFRLSRNDAEGRGEHSRLGCGPVRPRAGPGACVGSKRCGSRPASGLPRGRGRQRPRRARSPNICIVPAESLSENSPAGSGTGIRHGDFPDPASDGTGRSTGHLLCRLCRVRALAEGRIFSRNPRKA